MESAGTLITQLMSANNEERKAAEVALNTMRKEQPQVLAENLLNHINGLSLNSEAPKQQEACFTAILLKK